MYAVCPHCGLEMLTWYGNRQLTRLQSEDLENRDIWTVVVKVYRCDECGYGFTFFGELTDKSCARYLKREKEKPGYERNIDR